MTGSSSSASTISGHERAPLEALSAFDYQPIGRVVFEPGSLARLGELARSIHGTRVLLVTDPGLEHAGHPQRAEESLRKAGLAVFTFDGVKIGRAHV